MKVLPRSVEKVIEEFGRLPGIGPKTAARMAYHYIRSSNKDASKLADALNEMEGSIVFCEKCFNVSERNVCDICSSKLRSYDKICVVEEPLDVVAFEKAGIFEGVYFVLGGVISPADGIGAEELRFPQLKKRVEELVKLAETEIEVILATNPSLEGEATASYAQDLMKELTDAGKIKISRLAMGLPTGADLEYADRLTLKRAMEGRG
ncbi:recombination protein RecR [Candidatus Dojkabacteria bacterium]|nr:recombination protein RecR [Candidatus Dojkabacteria bacterium]